ncbi:MAG: hypothetical protein RL417_1656, partial [Pseudomonadota bacterium]
MRTQNTYRLNPTSSVDSLVPKRVDRGAVIPEYVIVLGVFVGVAAVMSLAFTPLSMKFHN